MRSVGFNHIDTDYCKEHNIAVVNSPGYGNITVAEFALALLLNVARKVTESYTDYKSGCVKPENLIGTELCGKTVGIVGLGAIGSAFAKIAHGLSMNILGFDKYEKEELKQNMQNPQKLIQQNNIILLVKLPRIPGKGACDILRQK